MLPFHLKEKPKSSYEIFRNAVFMSVTTENNDLTNEYLEVAKILAPELSELEMKELRRKLSHL